MIDPRLRKLAEILVRYSTRVKPGDWVHIDSSPLALPLVRETMALVLEAGGNPTVSLTQGILDDVLFAHAAEEQLKWVSPLELLTIQKADVLIGIRASENTRALSNVLPEKQQIQHVAYREWMSTYMQRSASGDLRWVITEYPCPALAQEADLGLTEFEDFIFKATFADQEDPVACWQKVYDHQARLIQWLAGKETITIRSPHADLTLSIRGRRFMNSAGDKNMPSGEIFTSPVEDSANGWVDFTYPAIVHGREVEGVHLEFKEGRVVSATARKNEDYLRQMLEVDEGAHFLGELGIGTNYGIQRFTKSILYDEKIGGSFHLALGNGFPEAGGSNQSSLHWDLICDARENSEMRADGEPFYQNGQFCI
jgi:aminopeptidase